MDEQIEIQNKISSPPPSDSTQDMILKSRKRVSFGFAIAIMLLASFTVAYLVWAKANEAWPFDYEGPWSEVKHREKTDVEGWKTYSNEEYGFEFKYPSELKFTTASPGGNHLIRGFRLARDPVYIEGGVSTSESIKKYNDACRAEAEAVECIGFAPLDCEKSGSSNCSEYFFAILAGSWYKKAVVRNDNHRIEFNLLIDEIAGLEELEKPTDDLVFKTVNEGKVPEKARDKIQIFNQILSTFKFITDKPAGPTTPPMSQPCIQVITTARNSQTGEIREFPTPCDVPEGWVEIRN